MTFNLSRNAKLPPCPYMDILLKMGKAESSFDIGSSSSHAIDYQTLIVLMGHKDYYFAHTVKMNLESY